MNRRNFIITTGAVLALIMLATCYAAVTAIREDEVPSITEEYRQSTLNSEGNPFLQLRDDFAEMFLILGERLTGR